MLRIGGDRFSTDRFLAESSLTPIAVFRKGEPAAGRRVAERDGVNVDVSKANGSDLPGQIADALQFLNTHRDELQRLHDDLGTDAMCLDFGLWDQATDERPCSSHTLPSELLWLAGELGIQITLSLYGRQADVGER